MKRRIIAFANHKGGVGKTTSVASVAVGLASHGFKVLLIDLDAQANLSSFFVNYNEEEERRTIYDCLVGGGTLPIYELHERVHMCPSSLEMARADADLNGKLARERILARKIAEVEEAGFAYDYILIDCPPSLGIVTTNALVAATDIYVPLTAEALPLKGMRMLDEFVEALHIIRDDIEVTGVFITRYNNRKINKVVVDRIKELYGEKLFDTKIRENISLAEVPLSGGNIFRYAPDSNGAKDYAKLVKEIRLRTCHD